MKVFVKKVHKDAEIPQYAFYDDAGCDVKACWVKETDKYVEYGIGLAFEVDVYEGNEWFISGRPRSSISKYDLIMCNAPGTIDNGYRNEVTFRFKKVKSIGKELKEIFNSIYDIWTKKETLQYPIDIIAKKCWQVLYFLKNYEFDDYKIYEVGDKIGQLILQKRPKIEFIEVDELNPSERNMGGYGHTGK